MMHLDSSATLGRHLDSTLNGDSVDKSKLALCVNGEVAACLRLEISLASRGDLLDSVLALTKE